MGLLSRARTIGPLVSHDMDAGPKKMKLRPSRLGPVSERLCRRIRLTVCVTAQLLFRPCPRTSPESEHHQPRPVDCSFFLFHRCLHMGVMNLAHTHRKSGSPRMQCMRRTSHFVARECLCKRLGQRQCSRYRLCTPARSCRLRSQHRTSLHVAKDRPRR